MIFFFQFSHKTDFSRVVSFPLEPNFYRDRRELPFEFSKDIYIYKTTPLTHLPLMLSSRARTIFCSLHNIQLRVEIAGNFFPPFPLFLSFSLFIHSREVRDNSTYTSPLDRFSLTRKCRNPLSTDGNCSASNVTRL